MRSESIEAAARALLEALSDTRYHGIDIGTLGEPMRALRAALEHPTPPAPAEVVLWRVHGTAGFRTPAWNEMYCYDGCGCRPYVAVPLAQREAERRRIKTLEDDANRLQRDRDACLDEIRRVYEAIGVDPFKDRFTTCAADVAAKLAALRGKEAPRG